MLEIDLKDSSTCEKLEININEHDEHYYRYSHLDKYYFIKVYKGTKDYFNTYYIEEVSRLKDFPKHLLRYASLPNYHECTIKGNDFPCICMDYIEGKTLQEYLEQKHDRNESWANKLGPVKCYHIMRQVKEILSALYANGILYLDLRPANMIITDINSLDLTFVDHTFCLYIDKINLTQIRVCSNHFPKNKLLPEIYEFPEKSLVAVSALFFASLFYGGNTERFPSRYREDLKRILLEMNPEKTGRETKLRNLLEFYPNTFDLIHLNMERDNFYMHYSSLEDYFNDLFEFLPH